MQNVDVRIKQIDPLVTPAMLSAKYPVPEDVGESIAVSRKVVNAIIKGEDPRLLAIIGPCSIHDRNGALDYARRLKDLSETVSDEMFVVMRTYFEKPRTILGWKGFILDPQMEGSYDIGRGLEQARALLLEITSLGLPVGCEVLDPFVPQYIDELMSWSSIGARTRKARRTGISQADCPWRSASRTVPAGISPMRSMLSSQRQAPLRSSVSTRMGTT
jgi:3-deoxy-7-phosphoheptulonate synthase